MTVRPPPNQLGATGTACPATTVWANVKDHIMKRTPIRVEPFASYLERRRKGPIYPVIVAGETVYVSGLPPFEPETGEIKRMPFEQQADIVLSQALPIDVETVPGFDQSASSSEACATLEPGEAATKEVPVEVGRTRIEVAPGSPATIGMRRFAEGEFPAQLGSVEGGTTTTLTVPRDRAEKQWYVHVEAAQLVRVCR